MSAIIDYSRTGRWFAYHAIAEEPRDVPGIDPRHALFSDEGHPCCIHVVDVKSFGLPYLEHMADDHGGEIGGGWTLFPETRDYLVELKDGDGLRT